MHTQSFKSVCCTVAVLTAASALTHAATWNVAGPTNNWSTSGGDTNWDAGATWTNGNNQAVFGGVNGEAITVSSVTASQITFNNTGTAYNLSGGTITLNRVTDPVINATVDATISSSISLAAAQTWAVSAGKTLTLGNINATGAGTAFGVSGAGSYLFNGSIGGNVGNVLFNGAAGANTTATFTTANTFTGQLWLGQGGNATTLNFSDVNQLGTGANDTNFIAIQNGSTLNYTGTGSQSTTAGRGFYWNAGAATIGVTDANANLTIGGTAGTQRNNNFTKNGAGTLTLNSTATITGGTVTVNAGNLIINSTKTGGGNVSVSAGARLGGTGTLDGTSSVAGNLLGGNGLVASGTLTLSGAVTFAATSQIQLALGTGGLHSSLALTGAETFDGTQDFNFIDLGAAAGTYAGLITGVTADPGTLANWQIVNSGWLGNFTYNAGTQAIDLTLSAVPEPGAALLGGIGMLALLRRRRTA